MPATFTPFPVNSICAPLTTEPSTAEVIVPEMPPPIVSVAFTPEVVSPAATETEATSVVTRPLAIASTS